MSEFINYELDDSDEAIERRVYDSLTGVFPEWQPREGHLEVVLTEKLAEIIAEVLALQNDVPPAIFRWFGRNIMGFDPIDAQFATVSSTWTVTPSEAGHTIPAGTVAFFEGPGDEAVTFETVDDVDIAPDATTTGAGEVLLRAQEAGEQGNGFTDNPRLLDFLEFVESVAIVGSTSGGQDAETDETYQNRLSERMRLLADRPVIAEDVERFARVMVPSIMRAVAFDNYIPNGVNEQQTIVHTATGGTFTINLPGGVTTGAIQWNANAAAIKAAIEATTAYAEGDVDVTGGPLPALTTVTFRGKFGRQNVAAMTAGTNSLTGGGGAGSLAFATTVAGTADNALAERSVTIVSQDEFGNASSSQAKALLLALLNATREPNFDFYAEDQKEWTIDVSVTVKAWEDEDTVALQESLVASIQNFLNKALWGQPPLGETREWDNETVVRVSELNRIILNTDGVRRIEVGPTLARRGDALAAADVTLYGLAPVPVPGTITVTVNP